MSEKAATSEPKETGDDKSSITAHPDVAQLSEDEHLAVDQESQSLPDCQTGGGEAATDTQAEDIYQPTEEELAGSHDHVVYEITVAKEDAREHPMIITLRAPIPEAHLPLDKKVCTTSSGICCKDTDAWVSADIDKPQASFYIIRSSTDVISSIVLHIRFSKYGEEEGVIQFTDSMKFELDDIPNADGQVTKNVGPILNSSMLALRGQKYRALVKRVGTETVANKACPLWDSHEWTEVDINYDEGVCKKGKKGGLLRSIASSFRSKD